MNSIADKHELLSTVTTRIAETLHVLRAAFFLYDNNSSGLQLAYAVGYSDPPPARIECNSENSEIVRRLSHERRPLPLDANQQLDHCLREIDPLLLVPLAHQDKLLGVLSLGAKRSEEPYSPSDVRLLESVATQTALALENSDLTEKVVSELAQREVLNRELEIAKEVQQRLFPQNEPELPGFEYAGACRPARHIGGDYYDFLELPNSWFGIAIGDIAGTGISAALLMASLHAALRGQVVSGTRDLAQVISNVNQLLYDATAANRYATQFVAQLDPSTRTLIYVNGGHNAPMLLRRDGGLVRLNEGGPVVGLFPHLSFVSDAMTLAPGDELIAFTDGITEAMNAAGEEYGEERLLECVRSTDCIPLKELVAAIFASVDSFANCAVQHDDMTLMVLRVKDSHCSRT